MSIKAYAVGWACFAMPNTEHMMLRSKQGRKQAMKRYYVQYYARFSNTYNLAYTETEAEEKQAKEQGYERITRKEAEHLCALENQRRKDDPAFAYSADSVILPIGYDDDWRNDGRMVLAGYIVERRNK